MARLADPNHLAAGAAPRTTGPLPRRVIKEAFLDHVDESRFSRFVASSNRIDRYGDIIEQEWALDDFMKNPVFLWSHNSWGEPIGWVREFEANAERTETVARVEFAPAGHDPFVDKLVRAVNMRLIRAVSVGFVPVEMEDRLDERGRWDGYRFLRSALIELSLCTIPANPDALNLARTIDADPKFLRAFFAEGSYRARQALAPMSSAPAPVTVGSYVKRDNAIAELERFKSRSLPGVSGAGR
jgi:HK97 family phage prohead protease